MGTITQAMIAAAVEHLKEPALERAEEATIALAERYQTALKEANWDLEVAFPHPDAARHSLADYQSIRARHNMAARLTCHDTTRNPISRRMKDPHYRMWSPDSVAALVREARDLAAQQYDTFIAKLAMKIEQDGPVVEVFLTGSHVWGHSTLTVIHADGSVHKWRTEMIINVSKLGTLFNQWPTRKLKPASPVKRKAA
ncbi:hypothetical protein [Aeromonas salmonicida]|uniref:hypothetical protein n=1 Tax=Aeromonas salmonicida TaxID=645 RepID=UPI00233089E2|nr:hypothetical protein [Aeromonas salmonicida]WCH25145.1 hypothetical protein ONZ54_23045 [Aeromonas salmonicida]